MHLRYCFFEFRRKPLQPLHTLANAAQGQGNCDWSGFRGCHHTAAGSAPRQCRDSYEERAVIYAPSQHICVAYLCASVYNLVLKNKTCIKTHNRQGCKKQRDLCLSSRRNPCCHRNNNEGCLRTESHQQTSLPVCNQHDWENHTKPQSIYSELTSQRSQSRTKHTTKCEWVGACLARSAASNVPVKVVWSGLTPGMWVCDFVSESRH